MGNDHGLTDDDGSSLVELRLSRSASMGPTEGPSTLSTDQIDKFYPTFTLVESFSVSIAAVREDLSEARSLLYSVERGEIHRIPAPDQAGLICWPSRVTREASQAWSPFFSKQCATPHYRRGASSTVVGKVQGSRRDVVPFQSGEVCATAGVCTSTERRDTLGRATGYVPA